MAQMISGLTMQLLNHSRAASGAEHLMAHLVEMKPPRFENAHGMHGQCVGVGTYLCAKEYHYLASLPTPKAKPFEPLTRAWVDEKFGPLADGIMKENENDVLGTFDPQNIVDHWDEIRAIIAEIPSAEELAALCEKLGAFYKPEQIGIDPALSEDMLSVSGGHPQPPDAHPHAPRARFRRIIADGNRMCPEAAASGRFSLVKRGIWWYNILI